MLSQKTEEQLAQRLVNRIEDVTTFILRTIGNNIKYISKLKLSKAREIRALLLYNTDYIDTLKELSKVSAKNVEDIYKIFGIVAKENKKFAKQFYEYKGLEYVPYNKDKETQRLVNEIALQSANDYLDIANAYNIGFVQNGQFTQLEQVYQNVVNEAIENIEQDYNKSMEKTIKELGSSGLVRNDNGKNTRLEAVIYANLLEGIREVNNQVDTKLGNEYGADGYEISVHGNPAPDHADIQGRQFSKEEFEKLQEGLPAIDYEGEEVQIGHSKKGGYRPISEYNCYHKRYSVILGASEPLNSNKELRRINRTNKDGFTIDGKHYTNYEGTQIQRKIETEIRKQKDTYILAKASGNKAIMQECEKRIKILKSKYNELVNVSGLEPKDWRMSVSGYRR